MFANTIAGIPLLSSPVHHRLSQLHSNGQIDLARFAQWFRDEPLAFGACDLGRSPETVLRQSFELAQAVGAHSISLGVAAVMHLYMLGALSSFPLDEPSAKLRRAEMLGLVQEQRWLVANSGSDMEVRSANNGRTAMVAELTSEGWRVSGHKTFVSLATEADLLIFTATEKSTGTPISLFTPLRGLNGIRLEESPFPSFLEGTGTRSVIVEALVLPVENAVSGSAGVPFDGAHAFQRMWFCAMVPSVYLGAAAAAMSEARSFARGSTADSTPLADLDGVAVEFGRLALTLGAAFRGFEAVSQAIGAASLTPSVAATEEAADLAAAFKYTAMRAVSEVATALRRFVGTRSMVPGSNLLRFQQESLFGSLHPELEPLMERRLGRKYLRAA